MPRIRSIARTASISNPADHQGTAVETGTSCARCAQRRLRGELMPKVTSIRERVHQPWRDTVVVKLTFWVHLANVVRETLTTSVEIYVG